MDALKWEKIAEAKTLSLTVTRDSGGFIWMWNRFFFYYYLGTDFITQIKQDRCITVLVVFVIVCVCPYANIEQRFVLLVSRIVFGLLVNYQAAPFDRPQMKKSQQKRD